MIVQKIGRRHGDGSINYNVRIVDNVGGEAVVACDTEQKADVLISSLCAAQFTCQQLVDVVAAY